MTSGGAACFDFRAYLFAADCHFLTSCFAAFGFVDAAADSYLSRHSRA